MTNLKIDEEIQNEISLTNAKYIGLGTGSTVEQFCKNLPINGLVYFPTSIQSSLVLTNDHNTQFIPKELDLYIDSVDHYCLDSPVPFLIKGMGGALHKEKLFYYNSSKTILIVNKLKKKVNWQQISSNPKKYLVPVEIIKESLYFIQNSLKKKYNLYSELKMCGSVPFLTVSSNFILLVEFNEEFFTQKCKNLIGIVENGYFVIRKNVKIIEY